MKKILSIFIATFVLGLGFTRAQSLIPEGNSVSDYVSGVSVPGHVLEKQKDLIKNGDMSMTDQINSGIMSWDTILDYCVYLVKFLGEVALLAGAVAIIFLGYKRITKNIFMDTPPFLKVIIGILVVIAAYVIVKILWYAFIS